MAGRNAAQLRAAAVATGWFDGPELHYVGDGYSIPWETGLIVAPGFGGSLLAWKSYLDRNYLEPSRLHDWLYTPYGPGLIGADQAESDLALREEMLAAGLDPIQAEVIYRACQAGGGLYFGRSSVGWVAIPPSKGRGTDIPLAGKRSGVVADFKVVMIFQMTTAIQIFDPPVGYAPVARTAGWTESYYDAGTTLDFVLARLKGPRPDSAPPIGPSRAAILPNAAKILAARIYQVGVGKGTLYTLNFSGGSWVTDVPSMALLMSTDLASTPTSRRFMLRCIPDSQVVSGEFAPTSNFSLALKDYCNSLQNTSVYGRNPGTTLDVFDIKTNGLVTLKVPHTYAVGQFVSFKNTLTTEGFRRGGEYMISAVGPLGNQFTAQGWLWGDTTGGTVTQITKGFFPVGGGDTKAVRITNRKVGRPFASFRGRKSKKTGPKK